MMNRRLFLRNAALLTAGVVAADQLEILERLAPRRLWAGANFIDCIPLTTTASYGSGYTLDQFRVGNRVNIIRAGRLVTTATITSTKGGLWLSHAMPS